MKKLCILCMLIILLFSCFTSANAIEKDRVTTATKMLALCFQAKNLYRNFDKFVLFKGIKYISLSSLYGTVGGNTECFGYILDTPKKVYIVFRGSESLSDIVNDFVIRKTLFEYIPDGGYVHKGFFSIYNNTCPQQTESLRDQIMGILENISPNKQLYITGFSLGGALATLGAPDIAVNSQFKDPIVYTFASPRVGDQQFVDVFNKNIRNSTRVINYYDYVPSNPIQWLGYRHVKGQVNVNVNTGRIDKNHRMDVAYFPALVASSKDYSEKLMRKHEGLCPPLPENLPEASWEEQQEMSNIEEENGDIEGS